MYFGSNIPDLHNDVNRVEVNNDRSNDQDSQMNPAISARRESGNRECNSI